MKPNALTILAILSISGSIAGGVSTWGAPEDNLPPAAEILDKHVEATGGKAAYARIHDIYSTGTFEVVGTGMRGTLTSYEAEPGKSLSILDIPGGERIQEGTNGNVAWVLSSQEGARLKGGEEKAVALREVTFNAKVLWRKLYPKVDCVGTEVVNGQTCYKVVLKPAIGQPITHYYDTKSNLLIKSVIPVKGPDGEIPSENFYSNYKEVNGILFPHALNHRVGKEEILVVLDSIHCNTDIAWYRFDLPKEVQALLRKGGDSRR
jgi:hypothetical protein